MGWIIKDGKWVMEDEAPKKKEVHVKPEMDINIGDFIRHNITKEVYKIFVFNQDDRGYFFAGARSSTGKRIGVALTHIPSIYSIISPPLGFIVPPLPALKPGDVVETTYEKTDYVFDKFTRTTKAERRRYFRKGTILSIDEEQQEAEIRWEEVAKEKIVLVDAEIYWKDLYELKKVWIR